MSEADLIIQAAHERYRMALTGHVALEIERLKLQLTYEVARLELIMDDLTKVADRLPETAIGLEF